MSRRKFEIATSHNRKNIINMKMFGAFLFKSHSHPSSQIIKRLIKKTPQYNKKISFSKYITYLTFVLLYNASYKRIRNWSGWSFVIRSRIMSALGVSVWITWIVFSVSEITKFIGKLYLANNPLFLADMSPSRKLVYFLSWNGN